MLVMSCWLKRPWPRVVSFVAFAACLLCVAAAWPKASGQTSHAGRVVGFIDGFSYDGGQFHVVGWACQQGNPASVEVHVYADRSAYDKPPGTFVTAGRADLDSAAAVGKACQDPRGGKHRFKIDLSNQALKTYHNRILYAHGIAVARNVENSAIAQSGSKRFPEPRWPPAPPRPDLLDGARVAVFDTAKDSCEQVDIPDAQARAFRDDKGVIHLVASHYVTRASLGPTLESVKHNCEVVYKSGRDGHVENFDDATWLDSFFSIDGRRIVALGHMEYHGWEHAGMCASKSDTAACWYNVVTFFTSEDGGHHFASPKPPANFAVGLPFKYEVNQGPEGYSVDANIIKVGDWYYTIVTDWPWPPNCGNGKRMRACLVPGGAAPIRTSNILDPSSWRGWDGKEFSVVFTEPYRGAVAQPKDHVYTPVPNLYYVNAINLNEGSHLFIATLWDPWNTAYGPEGLYLTTSTDLVHWSKPALAITRDQLLQNEPGGNWSYSYFSLIDPKSTDSNFSTITDNPYLYYVRSDENHGPYNRVLFRQRIKLGWLTAESRNAGSPSAAEKR